MRVNWVCRIGLVSAIAAAWVVVGVCVAPASAGAATNVAPADGARVANGRPLLTWKLAEGERAVSVELGATRRRGTGGVFRDDGVSYALPTGATSLRLPEAVLSGRRFWSVTTFSDERPGVRSYGPVTSFTVPLVLEARNLRADASIAGIDIRFDQRTNASRYSVTYRIKRGRVLVGGPMYPNATGSTHGRWELVRELVRFGDMEEQGARLTVTVALRSGKVTRTLTRTVTVR